jgi:3-methyladenine DNA glycosylase AlkD
MSACLSPIQRALRKHASLQKAKILQSFFKTGKGQYGEGDVFIGVTVPNIRKVARTFSDLKTNDILKLLHSKIHEERLLALLIWVIQYEKSEERLKRKIFDLYLKNTRWVNNWDLVDLSAPKIAGAYLLGRPRDILYKLARAKMLWERRIAVIATFAFIREGQFRDTLAISKILLKDKEDLMHKACGWMLRETGKQQETVLIGFLEKYCRVMPRTMLRYSIERLKDNVRRKFMAAKSPRPTNGEKKKN